MCMLPEWAKETLKIRPLIHSLVHSTRQWPLPYLVATRYIQLLDDDCVSSAFVGREPWF